jgi:hypothetical protein
LRGYATAITDSYLLVRSVDQLTDSKEREMYIGVGLLLLIIILIVLFN